MARNLGHYHGTGETVPFVNRTFEWGVIFATFLSVLSIVPRHCARLTYFIHPKLRRINAVLMSPQPIPLPLWRAGSIPIGCRNSAVCEAMQQHFHSRQVPVTSTPAPPTVWRLDNAIRKLVATPRALKLMMRP